MLHAGTVPMPQDAFVAKCENSRGGLPVHEDSAWDALNPQTTSSYSTSSLVTTSTLGFKSSCDGHTHSGNQSMTSDHKVAPVDGDDVNMTCLRNDKQHRSSKDVDNVYMTCLRHNEQPESNKDLDEESMTCLRHEKRHGNGNKSKLSKVLHWLTDPDSRDARRARKTGVYVEEGALYNLANATGRCPL